MKDKLKDRLFFGIIILGAVSVFVFALSARDEAETEAEVLTWSKTHEEPPEAVWYYDGEVTHRYLLDESEPNEPCESNITWSAYAVPLPGDELVFIAESPEPNEPEEDD